MIIPSAPDSPKSNLLPRYNSFLMRLIELLVVGLAALSTAAVAAMPVLLLRDVPPALTGAIAVCFAGFQWHTATITRRGWLEGVAQYWSKYDQANSQRGISTVLCRLPAIYCFPIDYLYALWSRSSPLFVSALVVGLGARHVPAPPLLVAAAMALIPPVCQMVRSAILLTPAPPSTTTTLRGQIRAVFDEALSRQTNIVAKAYASIPWGGLQLVIDRTFTHLTLVGNSRSGKTVNLRLILQKVLRAIGIDRMTAARAIIFDPKTNFIPYIAGMGVQLDKVRIMHPFDLRSWAWDIAADIDTPTDATNIAANFCPERKGGASEFFEPAGRDVLASVILAFHMTCPRKWDLRDLLLAHWTPARLKATLSRTPLTRNTLERYGGDPRTLANLAATLRKNLAPFEPVAACWQHVGKKKISLTQWRSSEAVLVFGYSDTAKEQLRIINRCMFQRLGNLLLSGEGDGRSWLFVDECREQGELLGLSSILVRGAEHQVHAVLGFQSVLGMQEVYGEKVAGEILGQCNNLAVFRLGNDRKTAEWAAEVIGKAERLERHRSETEGRDRSQTTSESTHDRYLYMPEELQNLPATCPEHGLKGIFVSEQYGVVDAADAQISGAELFGEMLLPPDESVPAFMPRPHSQHYLKDWNDDDLRRLGFKGGDGDALSRVRRM